MTKYLNIRMSGLQVDFFLADEMEKFATYFVTRGSDDLFCYKTKNCGAQQLS